MSGTDTKGTLQALTAMTSPGEFERLAIAVLRRATPHYTGVVHTGVNAFGQTVKDPLDGILSRTLKEPPEFIIVEQTLEKNLEKKWLNRPKSKGPKTVLGDVHKAVDKSKVIRADHESAVITLVLTTNQTVKSELFTDVSKVCILEKIELEVWELHRLSDFLDTHPDGQWIRKQYLGISQERLSSDLLLELCSTSIEQHRATLFEEHCSAFITRKVDRQLANALEAPGGSLVMLVGESGLGKSTAVHQLLGDRTAAGSPAIWLPAELVERNPTLESALSDWLKKLYPSVQDNAGAEALRLSESSGGLYVVIDDINRSSSPTRLLEKIVAWSFQPAQEGGRRTARITCPLWNRTFDSLPRSLRTKLASHVVLCEAMSEREGIALLQKQWQEEKAITDLDASEIVAALGGDPLLLVLWTRPITSKKQQPTPLALIESYIWDQLRENVDPLTRTATECRSALESLAVWMLAEMKLAPTWDELASDSGLASNTLEALRSVVSTTHFCYLDSSDGVETLRFRHDRLRDCILSRALANQMNSQALSEKALSEPFFAEYLGQALLQCKSPTEFLAEVLSKNPLALFECSRVLADADHPHRKAIIESCAHWLSENPKPPTAILWEIEQKLARTQGRQILELTTEGQISMSILEARLRNGDAAAGAQLCYRLEPSIGAASRDAMIAQGLSSHADLVTNVANALSSKNISDSGRVAYLRLAGHMAVPELAPHIEECWRGAKSQHLVLSAALWAALRCWNGANKSLLQMLDCWRGLSDEDESGFGISPRGQLAEYDLKFALARGVHDGAIEFLVSNSDDSLRWPLLDLLGHINQPKAVEHTVREAAKIYKKCVENGTYSPWLLTNSNQWNPDHPHGKVLSAQSMLKLNQMWADSTESIEVRRQSFLLWAASYRGPISVLVEIDEESPLYKESLRKRMLLGDSTTVGPVEALLKIDTNLTYWMQFFPSCWSDDYRALCESIFARRRNPQDDGLRNLDHALSRVLFRIAPIDAEEILLNYWDELKDVDVFIQVGLYLATEQTLQLVERAVAQSKTPGTLFRHLGMHFGFSTTGRPEITPRQLHALEPYLPYFNDLTLRSIWDRALALGMSDWAATKVLGHIAEKFRPRVFSESMLQDELDSALKDDMWGRIPSILEDFAKQGASSSAILDGASNWMSVPDNARRWGLYGLIMSIVGDRSDIDRLELLPTDSLPDSETVLESIRFAVKRRTLQ